MRNIFDQFFFVAWYLRDLKKKVLIYFMTFCCCPKLPHQALCPGRALLPGGSWCQLGNLPWENFEKKKKNVNYFFVVVWYQRVGKKTFFSYFMTFCHYPKFTIVQADQLYLVEADDIWVISKGAILDKLLHKSGANVDTFSY